ARIARMSPSRSLLRVRCVRMVQHAFLILLLALAATDGAVRAQNPVQPLAEQTMQRDPLTPAPARARGEGFGPYQTMVVRGAMLIDGTGGPPPRPGGIVGNPNPV